MAQRRFHYERAFEDYLRTRRIPYVAVDEARKTLLPEGSVLRVRDAGAEGESAEALKSFDFVIYGDSGSLLVDVKGRKVGASRRSGQLAGRLESWVTMEDVESLRTWERLFGAGFEAAFVFVYWCDVQPPDSLFQEVLDHRGVWYALRAVSLREYREHMKVRSPRWGTVDIPKGVFERISQAFAPPSRARDDGDEPAAMSR